MRVLAVDNGTVGGRDTKFLTDTVLKGIRGGGDGGGDNCNNDLEIRL